MLIILFGVIGFVAGAIVSGPVGLMVGGVAGAMVGYLLQRNMTNLHVVIPRAVGGPWFTEEYHNASNGEVSQR